MSDTKNLEILSEVMAFAVQCVLLKRKGLTKETAIQAINEIWDDKTL